MIIINLIAFLDPQLDKDVTFTLVFDYATNGNLRNHLKHHFTELNWDTKLRFAREIVEGVRFVIRRFFFYNVP